MTIGITAATRLAFSRRGLLAGAGGLGLAAAAGPAAARQATPYALEDFFARDGVRSVALSPSGERIAIIRETWTGGQRRAVLDTLDAADLTRPPLRAPIGDVDCEAMEWASDDRLLVWVAVKTRSSLDRSSARSLIASGGDEIVSRRVISIDPDTGGAVVLFGGDQRRMRTTHNLGVTADLLHDDPEHVLMIAPTAARGIAALYKVNVLTGRAEEFERGDFDTVGWKTRNGVPVLRYDINDAGNTFEIMARAVGERQWTLVRRVPIFEAPEFAFVSMTDRDDVILVSARLDGEDVQSVRELNLRTREYGSPMTSREGADVAGGLTDDRGVYLGAAYWNDRLEYDFAEAGLAPHHRAMNRFFDDSCNVRLDDVDRARNRFIAYVSGPQEPGAWYLYDRGARSFVNLAPRTALSAERLARTEAVDVTTRDGATIRAYLTAPPGGAPGPLVVMPHGGPEVRDVFGWDRTVQVLAAQGWWVVQPNFRGSGGYGRAFAGEGWGRWGERMQEDVEDTVAQVVRERGLDGDRVGIMGISYGGYAALMGAVRRPDLYKAAIGVCGVYDLPEMLSFARRDDPTPRNEIYNYWVKRIGDPGANHDALDAASPRQRAEAVRCPVMLVHGVDDPVVPVFQSRRMKDALQAAGQVNVDYAEIPNSGHADWEDEVEQALLQRYVALLRRAFA
ncbi:S9 family peptidase [Brevundimonas sp.]|uniref:alpha/beta hydrolase family protein n=1 Tax=Brevundimonas sp. TaxID=1871086 RepID=UPI002737CC40|nr:alpha/beta fold hydrolase [Brevundimonas sp.]MDP3802808.1 alpha/beta fold hydrolase [Brevundimonas sp.]